MERIKEYIINERIWAKEVRLVDESGKQIGIVPTSEALRIARERGLDLVLISPVSKPPVARIADYGKLKYELSKKEKEARKTSKAGTIKEIKISSKIAQHDFDTRITKAKELLKKGYKVKFNLMFRGREVTHFEIGKRVMDQVVEALTSDGKPEAPAKLEGKNLSLIIIPNKNA